MNISRKILSLSFFVLAFGSLAVLPARADNYQRYCNDRFKNCVDVPSYLKVTFIPDNGDGLTFGDQNGLTISISAGYNVLESNSETELTRDESVYPRITYKKVKGNWYVLSGLEGSNIYYLKKIVNKDFITTLLITYPQIMKNDYAEIVKRASSSLTAAQ